MMMIITFKRATGKPLILNIIDINDEILIISQDKVNDILEKTNKTKNKFPLTIIDYFKNILFEIM